MSKSKKKLPPYLYGHLHKHKALLHKNLHHQLGFSQYWETWLKPIGCSVHWRWGQGWCRLPAYWESTGPDGLTTNFLTHAWGLIKGDVMATLIQFYDLWGRRWYLLNTVHITLIPKAKDAMRVKYFRPMSLMHSITKILCKLLSLRLAPFLQQIGSPFPDAC